MVPRFLAESRRAPLGAPIAALVGGGPRFTLNVALVAMANGATDKL